MASKFPQFFYVLIPIKVNFFKKLFSIQSKSNCNNHPEEKSCDTQLKMSLLLEKVA